MNIIRTLLALFVLIGAACLPLASADEKPKPPGCTCKECQCPKCDGKNCPTCPKGGCCAPEPIAPVLVAPLPPVVVVPSPVITIGLWPWRCGPSYGHHGHGRHR